MKTNFTSRAAFFNLRVLIGFAFCSIGLLRASAQIGGGGTTNYIPLWTSSVNLGNSNIYESGTKLGIGTIAPQGALDVHDTSDFFAIQGTNSRAGGVGVSGSSGSSHNGVGVYGLSANNSGFGVLGSNRSPGGIAIGGTATASGIAIKGLAVSVSGTSGLLTERPLAVWGSTSQSNGVGLAGTADDGFGVLGINSSQNSAAGLFQNVSTEGAAAGVEGETSSPAGYGVYGIATSADTSGTAYGVYGKSANADGVHGLTTAVNGSGVLGIADGNGSGFTEGVAGFNSATSGPSNGVYGTTASPNGVGGLFENTAGGLPLLARVTAAQNLFTVDGTGNGFFFGALQVNGNGNFGGAVHINGNLTVTGTLIKAAARSRSTIRSIPQTNTFYTPSWNRPT